MSDPSPHDDISSHPDRPKREHMDGPGITWRHGGPPDYTKVDRLYLAGRTRKHASDSLEKLVENLVKTWEFEATHKTDPKVMLYHMMTSSNGNSFRVTGPLCGGIHRSPVNSPHTGQWRGALMFSFICARINGWVNNREAGGLRRHRDHYDVNVMTI